MEEFGMKQKVITGIVLALFLIGTLTLAFNIQPVKASRTIYIRANGSVEGTDKIQRDGDIYTFTGNINDSIVVERDNIAVDGAGCTLQGIGSGKGIDLAGRKNVTVKNMQIKEFEYGIYFDGSSSNRIYGNNITGNNMYGVFLWKFSNNNSVSGNNLTNNRHGICFDSCSSNSVSENNITNNDYYGLYLGGGSNNSVSGNSIAGNNDRGIRLYYSSNNTFRNNDLINNTYNFDVSGGLLASHYIQDIDDSNTADGKSVYYWVNRRDVTIPLNPGWVALVNCTRITVQNLNLINNGQGILLAHTTNSTITKNNITNNYNGIWLFESSNNSVSGNNITNNDYYGLYLFWYSKYNHIYGNNITNNGHGIMFYISSNYNSIHENKITNNTYGIGLLFSSNNTFYHNNFIDNTQQVVFFESGYTNFWDDGYPSGGNYWSDYNGTDSNQDGIGDTPYIINEDNTDNYPLMGMFSDFPISSIGGYKLEETCHVTTISNSTIEGFELFIIVHIGTGEWVGGGIFLNVTGPEGTKGFCRFTIPKDLLDCPEGLEYWTVYLDGTDVTLSCNMWENSTHTFIYVPYNHSTQLWLEGTWIVPEFPTWTSILLMLIVLTVAIAIYKRRLPKTTIH